MTDREKQKMMQDIAGIETELQVCYIRIGKRVLEIAEQEQKGVYRLVDALVKKKKALSAARHRKTCPACLVQHEEENRFCRYCGEPLAAGEEATIE